MNVLVLDFILPSSLVEYWKNHCSGFSYLKSILHLPPTFMSWNEEALSLRIKVMMFPILPLWLLLHFCSQQVETLAFHCICCVICLVSCFSRTLDTRCTGGDWSFSVDWNRRCSSMRLCVNQVRLSCPYLPLRMWYKGINELLRWLWSFLILEKS